MKYTCNFSEYAISTIEILQLPSESFSACVDRLLVNLLPIAEDHEEFFGEQRIRAIAAPKAPPVAPHEPREDQ